jgi:hypothetical protein
MLIESVAFAVYLLCGVQLLGLVAAVIARMMEGTSHQRACQWLFLTSLSMVGATTIVSLLLDPASWFGSGATLGVMLLVATCDFNHSRNRRPS